MTSSPETTDPAYVVDTQALIWWLTDRQKLGARARGVFDAAERGETRLIISAIVIAELYYANRKWRLFADFGSVLGRLKAQPYITLVPFTPDDVQEFPQDDAVPEMHDRLIAGLARRLGLPLVTSDDQIRDAGLVPVVW